MRFHAFTNFADLFVEILQLPTGGTLSEIEDSLREVCSLPWPAFKVVQSFSSSSIILHIFYFH
jgi:hypothetical protein